jgi:hypothetical protein
LPQTAPADPWLVAGQAGSPLLQAVKLSQPDQVRTLTLPAPLLMVSDLLQGSSPQGGWLAVRTGSTDTVPAALVLVSLADGQVETISPILSAGLQNPLEEGSNPTAGSLEESGAAGSGPAGSGASPDGAGQARQAVEDPQALAWSPDGRMLAFVAAVDGPSSDLYVFTLADRQIRRLTTGLNQAATPFWSPDSRWIVHQEVKELQADGPWQSVAVWAAGSGAAGSGAGESGIPHTEIRRLYTPPDQGEGEVFLGWTQDETLIVYSRAGNGGRRLREVPLSARWSAPIYSPPFAEAAVDATGRLVCLLHDSSTGAAAGIPAGIYRLHAYSGTLQPALVGEWDQVTWWERAEVFTASGPAGTVALPVQGEAHLYPIEGNLSPSPDGKWAAGWGVIPVRTPPGEGTPVPPTPGGTPAALPTSTPPGPGVSAPGLNAPGVSTPGVKAGVRLYQPGGPALQELTGQPTTQLLWAADSRSLFFLAEGVLYQAAFPQAVPQALGEAQGLEGMGLVP